MPDVVDLPDAPDRAAVQGSPDGEKAELGWVHPHGMIGLSIVNFVLRILTLGVYHFWGKTEVRKRIWNAIRLNGEPLSYTGSGRELLLGFLVVFGIIVLPTIGVSFAVVLILGPASPWLGAYQLILYAAFFYLLGVAIHRAQRYRLTRTQWRGIRGGMEGSAWRYGWAYIWTALLIPLTLGWIVPWRTTKLQGMLIRDMRFGTRPFRFNAGAGPLYPRFVGLWFGGIAAYIGLIGAIGAIAWPGVLRQQETGLPYVPGPAEVGLIVLAVAGFGLFYGLVSAWYRAGMMNHFAAHTSFEGARFRGFATARGLIWLSISNFLILLWGAVLASLILSLLVGVLGGIAVLALGLGAEVLGSTSQLIASLVPVLLLAIGLAAFGLLLPVVQARSARYFVEHLALEGDLPVSAIVQGGDDRIRRGEGLAQAFDVDAF